MNEDIYDAIIKHRAEHPYCELCQKYVHEELKCDHPKNGYCGLFLLQAEKDKKEFNMHSRTNN